MTRNKTRREKAEAELVRIQDHVSRLSGLQRILWALSFTRPSPYDYAPNGTDDNDIILAQSQYQDALERHSRAFESCLNYLSYAKGDREELPSITCRIYQANVNKVGDVEIFLDFVGERACAFVYQSGRWTGHS